MIYYISNMPTFDQKVTSIFMELMSNIWDAYKDPRHVGKIWRIHSAVLIFTFWISYGVKFIYLLIKNKYYDKSGETKFYPLTYSWVVNLFILTVVFFIDFNERCKGKFLLGTSLMECALTIIPLYLIWRLIISIRFWKISKRKMRNNLPGFGELIYGLFDGALLYGLFNVTMNFRTKYKWVKCEEKGTGERELKNFKESEIKRTKKLSHNMVFEGDYTWGDPTIVNYTRKTKVSSVQNK